MKSLRVGPRIVVALVLASLAIGPIASWPIGEARRTGERDAADAAAVAESDASAALAWVRSLSDAQEREAAAATLLARVAETQPATAVEWAVQVAVDERSPLLLKVAPGWVARDAQAALDWAVARPRSAQHRGALIELALDRWEARDPGAAASWLRTHRDRTHGG